MKELNWGYALWAGVHPQASGSRISQQMFLIRVNVSNTPDVTQAEMEGFLTASKMELLFNFVLNRDATEILSIVCHQFNTSYQSLASN